MPHIVPAYILRGLFSQNMSNIYQKEVPAYGDLCTLVQDINSRITALEGGASHAHNTTDAIHAAQDAAQHTNQERHGAIRLASDDELAIIARLFALLGLEPVNYYDLSQAGLPVHSTAFRPIDSMHIRQHPFRVFTSLIRLEFIQDKNLYALCRDIIKNRHIIPQKLEKLLIKAEYQGGIVEEEASQFIDLLTQVFKMHHHVDITLPLYQQIYKIHPILADVICFKSPHINHLTPRTLDIDSAHDAMAQYHMEPKKFIEGPPKRNIPILLRQTSFKAIQEEIIFDTVPHYHTARFGEIEERGAALTKKGHALYQHCIEQAQQYSNDANYTTHLQHIFNSFPDTMDSLYNNGLIYVYYHQKNKNLNSNPQNIAQDIAKGHITYTPILYEDFLPISAAGIFRSNLQDNVHIQVDSDASQDMFEQALGKKIHNAHTLYAGEQQQSINNIYSY